MSIRYQMVNTEYQYRLLPEKAYRVGYRPSRSTKYAIGTRHIGSLRYIVY